MGGGKCFALALCVGVPAASLCHPCSEVGIHRGPQQDELRAFQVGYCSSPCDASYQDPWRILSTTILLQSSPPPTERTMKGCSYRNLLSRRTAGDEGRMHGIRRGSFQVRLHFCSVSPCAMKRANSSVLLACRMYCFCASMLFWSQLTAFATSVASSGSCHAALNDLGTGIAEAGSLASRKMLRRPLRSATKLEMPGHVRYLQGIVLQLSRTR